MTSHRYGLVLRQVGKLLGGGSVAALGTGQLLERFAVDRDEAAFEVLVNQHGPMVLGTCRRMLADPHDVDDAFQATFLVLARKAGSIQDADRLGPWLHGVARRVATRSRALSARRNARERSSVEDQAVEPPNILEGFELRAALDEELSRLPDKYRAPLVLCYLEGLTHDEAARQLRWPVGTVRSRLAGGRDRLRARLTRRGLAPSGAVPAILARVSIPQALLSTTVRVATSAGSVPAHVATLAKGALIAMMWNKLKMVAAVGLMAGLTAGGAGVAAQKGEAGKAEEKAGAQIKEERSEPKRGIVKISKLRHVNDQLEELQAERMRLNAEQDAISRKIEQIQFERAKEDQTLQEQAVEIRSRIDSLERRWKDLTSNGGVASKAEEPTVEKKLSFEQIEAEIERLRAERSVVDKKIKELESEHDKALRPLRKADEDLASREFELTQRWKKQEANAASTAVNDRIKQLEMQIADQAALIRSLQGRADQPLGAPAEKAAKLADSPMSKLLDLPKTKAIFKDARETPKVEAASGGKVDGAPDKVRSRTMKLSDSPPLYAMIAVDSSRITMVDPELKKSSTYRLPEGSRPGIIDPVVAGHDLFPIGMKGKRITELVVFDRKAWQWSALELGDPITRIAPLACLEENIDPNVMVGFELNGPGVTKVAAFSPWTRQWVSQDLKEPAKGQLHPAMYPEAMTCMVGRFFYVYSVPANKWAILELKTVFVRNGSGEDFGPKDGKIVIPEENVLHVFDVKTGKWTNVNMQDKK